MSGTIKVALIGDYNPEITAHRAIPMALEIAADSNDTFVEFQWINTSTLVGNINALLSPYQGMWCVPASPYENMDGALSAIRYARENSVPYIGTCGGFQHAVLEYAHNELQLHDAENAEVNPDSDFPLIGRLVCSLIEQDGRILLNDNTQIQKIYQTSSIIEQYHCSYGFNPEYIDLFSNTDLVVSGFDQDGDPRSIEITKHPFFIATAFQPERLALAEKNHPLINQFVLSMLL